MIDGAGCSASSARATWYYVCILFAQRPRRDHDRARTIRECVLGLRRTHCRSPPYRACIDGSLASHLRSASVGEVDDAEPVVRQWVAAVAVGEVERLAVGGQSEALDTVHLCCEQVVGVLVSAGAVPDDGRHAVAVELAHPEVVVVGHID